MNKTSLALGGYIIAALVIIAATVLAVADKSVPTELWTFGALALGVGGGATLPSTKTE